MPELKPRSIADESPYYKSFKEAKRNVNERSKRNFAKILKRGSLCIVFRGEPLRAASGGNSVRGEVRRNK